jgi:hypothetical protein
MSKETIMTTQMLTGDHISTPTARRRARLASFVAAACLLLGVLLLPSSALAQNQPVPACPGNAPWCAASFSASTINADGTADTQAGSHPFESTTSFAFSTDAAGVPTENMKDISVELPSGFVGDPNATPKCTVEELDNSGCPGASQI